ncbi:radical SAM protein [candidate division WOR-3 bacterium]|nr:radical SAM protein [candidate division WOR-3 bacterium]
MPVFGPVPSRRLGQSLGINNIPPKVCTYSCVYCQLGRTLKMQAERGPFYEPEEIVQQVKARAEKAQKKQESIDYITFVPDGEPTLDENLGREIELLKPLGFKIAVITNSSLMDREDVRSGLSKADWVSLKVDSCGAETWRKVNRPHRKLKLEGILKGMVEFSMNFKGELVTETMLVKDLNHSEEQLAQTAEFIAGLNPAVSYISIPIRPPAEKWAITPDEEVINRAWQIFVERIGKVEYLIGYEGNAFAFTGNVEEDILSITSVHPMREDGVDDFLKRAGEQWDTIRELIDQGKLLQIEFEGRMFYVRKLDRVCRKHLEQKTGNHEKA